MRCKLKTLSLNIVLPLALAACGDETISRMDATNAKAVSRGEVLYAANCASCHGDNLQGESKNWKIRKSDGLLPAPPHDVSGHTWHHSDAMLFSYTKFGGAAIAPKGFKSGMPAFGEKLSDQDIWSLLSFIKSQWPAQAQARQERANPRN
ncbi:c-type cytochrome [Varunaivibrio sulfuroxidans]|uniref:Mono/diheme cytochrome c family protein n=1 Tax=Varunaivibrio sulfuroxidans TaxID=1773489 RepID=A0A4R3J6U7_9PROT|nr:c-type cytochrome [Varunaivibrio sulfuroxidans]TCS60576.1 mono/diheme cytochrome c family protein [Varunaivibrio sulfuroxidans]WES30067.1 c-type cytochrome [Varunaivibrio sulfuroxidans]